MRMMYHQSGRRRYLLSQKGQVFYHDVVHCSVGMRLRRMLVGKRAMSEKLALDGRNFLTFWWVT